MGDLDLKAYLAEEAEKDRRGDALKASMRRGMSRNPDEYAKALALAAQTGKAPEFVEQFRPEIEVEQALTSIEGLVMSHPKSAEWLANEQHASLAHDDLGSLRRLEEEVIPEFKAALPPTFMDRLRGIGRKAMEGTLLASDAEAQAIRQAQAARVRAAQEMGQDPAQFHTGNAATLPFSRIAAGGARGVVRPLSGAIRFAERKTGLNAGVGQATQSLVQALTPDHSTIADTGPENLASTVGLLIPGLGVQKAVGMISKIPSLAKLPAFVKAAGAWAGAAAMAIPEAASEAEDTYDQNLARGLSKEEASNLADRVFWSNAALLTITDKIGWFSAGGVGRKMAAESVQEGGQQVTGNLATGRPVGEGVLESAGMGAGVAGAIPVLGGLLGGIVKTRRLRVDAGSPVTFEGGQRGLQALSEVAATSKLAQRSPEKFAEFVGNLTAGTEQETVRMDARVFFQDLEAKGLDPMAVAQEMGAKNLEEALAAGTDLLVPTATYARALAESPGLAEVVTPIAKFRAQDMTAREMEAFTQEAMAEFEAQAQGEAGQVATEVAPDQALVQIREAIRSQLVEVGFEPTTADTTAAPLAKMVHTLATREGLDPLEYFQSWGLSTSRVGFGDGASRVDTILKQLQAQAPQVAEEGAPAPVVDPWAEGMLFQGPVDQPVPRGIPFENLSEEARARVVSGIERDIQAWSDNPESFRQAYEADPETFGGRLVNGDIIRRLLPTVAENVPLGLAAGAFTDVAVESQMMTLYRDAVDRAIDQAIAAGMPVAITAGGQSSGKTRFADKSLERGTMGAVIDAPHDDFKSVQKIVDKVLQRGGDAVVFFVDRPNFFEAYKSMIRRAISEGRPVEVKDMIRKHLAVPGEMVKVGEHYRNQPRVHLVHLLNVEGQEVRVVAGGPMNGDGKDALSSIRNRALPTREALETEAREAYLDYRKGIQNGSEAALPADLERALGHREDVRLAEEPGVREGHAGLDREGQRDAPDLQPELQAGAEELGPIQQAIQTLGINPAQVASGADLLAAVRQVAAARPELAEVARDLERMLAGGDVLFQSVQNGGMTPAESPEFKEWFGDSKVVDASGSPLVVYHGSKYGLNGSIGNKKAYIGAMFLTDSKDNAISWANGETPTAEDGSFEKNDGEFSGNVYEYYLSIKKPITDETTLEEILGSEDEAEKYREEYSTVRDPQPFTASMEDGSDISILAHLVAISPTFENYIRRQGYDGWVYNDHETGGTTYIPFDPDQIREAIASDNSKPLFHDYKDDMSFGSKAWQEYYLGRNKDGGRRLNDRARRARRALQQAKSQRADKAELDRRAEELRVAEEEFRRWEEGVKAIQAADTLQSKAGFITLGNRDRVSIALLENANLSTFFHEFGGHLGLAMLEDLATREGASEQVKADWKAALDYLGVAPGEDIKTEHHEKFARSMEAYLMEGKAPSEDLKGAFARIKEWMKLVYRQLAALGVKLTPEVRGVFDRMFASDAEIEAARADLGETQALFATPEDMGVSPAEFALYAKARAQEIEAAKTMLELRLFKELERERKDVWKAERAEVEAEIRAQLEQQPVYQAFDILAKGEMPDGTPLKLNKGDLEAQIGKGAAKQLPRRFNRIYTVDGGVDLDTAAEFLGFESGGTLFDALVEMDPLKDLAVRLAGQEMARRHGDLMVDGTIADAAAEALHNSHREEALALELQALRRQAREVRPYLEQARKEQRQAEREDRRQAREALTIPPMETFRTSAREIVEGQPIRDLEPHRYLLAQRKHAREAFKALAGKDYQAAADAKQKELLSHFLYLEALKAKEEADKIARYARKAEKTSFQAMLGKAGEEYQAQFNALLDRYEFRAVTLKELDRRAETLAEFAQAQVANGEVIDFDPELFREQPKNYREMTLPELRAVKDALKNIETIARRQLEFVVAGKKMTREEIREAFTGWTPPEERTPVHLEGDRLRWSEKVGRAVRGLDAEFLKVEWMVDRFDRGDINGPMRTYLKSLVDDADGRRQEMAFQMFKKIEALAKARDPQQVKRGDQVTKIRFPKRSTPLTYDQLIAWALNMGAAENQKVALLGEGLVLGDGSLSPVVDQALSEIHSSDWAFIQGVWDTLEELRAPLAAEHRRKTGLEMGLKELTPFSVTSADGVEIKLRGGYYPLVASSVTNVGQTQADPLNTAGRGRNSRARVNTGMTQQVTGATYQLKLEYPVVLSKHVHQTITNITFGETVEAVNWILGDEAIRNALAEKLGPEYVATLQGWVKDTIENPDDAPEQDAVIRQITRFKSGATIATLAGSIPSLAVQLSDWAKPLFAPGIKNGDLLKARYDLSLNYREIVADIHRLSPNVMRHRAENFHRELRDLLQARNAFEGKNQATARFLMQAFSIMDAQVTLPAWLAVYRRGLAEHGIEAQAVAEADRFVSRTFQAGGPRDMSALFRSRNGWARLFTTFQNDGNTWYGIISSAVASKKIGRISMALMGAFIGQALGQILKNRGWGDDDDEEAKKKWVVQQALLTGINSLPIAGSVLDGALGVTGFGGGGDYTTSAMVRTAKAFAKPFVRFDDLDWEEMAMAEAEALGTAFGVPLTAQMIRTWKYTHKVRKGEARPEGPADAAVDAVFGQNPREKR